MAAGLYVKLQSSGHLQRGRTPMDLYRYSLKGRSLSIPGRVIRLTVTAANADDARAMAKARVPDFGTTVESPRRGPKVVTDG